MSIRDVALAVAAAAGLPPDRVKFDATKSDGQFKKTACNAKLAALRPDFQFTPMADGIQQVGCERKRLVVCRLGARGAHLQRNLPCSPCRVAACALLL